MLHDYLNDRYGRECLRQARECRASLGFGAVLVKDGEIIGRGRNRRSTPEERRLLSHVDYGIHAEQGCVIDALRGAGCINDGKIVDTTVLRGSEIYVLGIVLQGESKERLTTKEERVFICKKCPPSVLIPYDVPVNIPHIQGWVRLTPQEAMETAERLCGKGYWRKFAKKNN